MKVAGCLSSRLGVIPHFGLTHCVLSKTSYLAVKVSLRAAHEEIYIFCLFSDMVSFRGQKKLGPRPDRSPLEV